MNQENLNSNSEEIELSSFFKEIKSYVISFLKLIFRVIEFYRSKWIWIILIILLGAIGGYMMDVSWEKTYKNEIIVIPNYKSCEYLYNSIAMFESKIEMKDTAGISKVGLQELSNIREIKIEPITDIYKLITRDKLNIEVFKILADKGDIKKLLRDPSTANEFKFHKITFIQKGTEHAGENIDNIMKFLNNNAYFSSHKHLKDEFYKEKIAFNQKQIVQIDSLLEALRAQMRGFKNGGSVNIQENSQINEIIQTKEALFTEIEKTKERQIDESEVISEVSRIMDVRERRIFGNKMIALPVYLLILFSSVFLVINFYKTLKTLSIK